MSNVIAGVVRNQFPHLEEHIAQKKAIYAIMVGSGEEGHRGVSILVR